jgi:hypothetical protein
MKLKLKFIFNIENYSNGWLVATGVAGKILLQLGCNYCKAKLTKLFGDLMDKQLYA